MHQFTVDTLSLHLVYLPSGLPGELMSSRDFMSIYTSSWPNSFTYTWPSGFSGSRDV